jgi:hypothetical protein
MTDIWFIERLGDVIAPPLSATQKTAQYTTRPFRALTMNHLSPYAKRPNSEASVELPTATLSPATKSADFDSVLDDVLSEYPDAWRELA